MALGFVTKLVLKNIDNETTNVRIGTRRLSYIKNCISYRKNNAICIYFFIYRAAFIWLCQN